MTSSDRRSKTAQPGVQAVQSFNNTGHVASAIAHDFNNILTGILGNLELMQRRADRLGVADFNDYLQGARSAGARGIAFTQSLLAIAGHQKLEPKRFSPRQFAGKIQEQLTSGIDNAVMVTVECSPDAPEIICDEAQFEDAIMQLAKQSVTQSGARQLTLSIARRMLGQDAADYALSPGLYAAFTLEDDGDGLSDEEAAHAFEAFHPTQGSGGLTRAKLLGFARQSGGHAFMEAHQAGKMRVVVLLPSG